MSEDAYRRFLDSKVMDFEKWHDGLGYDLNALRELSADELDSAVAGMIPAQGWRDLEALDYAGTAAATAAIVAARQSDNAELRLTAYRYGPKESTLEEAEILTQLEAESPSTDAIEEAAEYPSPPMIQALLRIVRECTGVEAYGAVASLLVMHGNLDSVYSMDRRPFILRFVDPPNPDRDAAYAELIRELGL